MEVEHCEHIICIFIALYRKGRKSAARQAKDVNNTINQNVLLLVFVDEERCNCAPF